MKKHLLVASAVMLLANVAFAAEKAAPADKKAPAELHCAVMSSNKVNVKDATEKKMFADYKGNRYFFCCAGCPAEFKKNPAKYVKADHIPTPKDAK